MIPRDLLHAALAALVLASVTAAPVRAAGDSAQPAPAVDPRAQAITVAVLGAVDKPGRETVPAGSRVSDAIAAAVPHTTPATSAFQQSLDAHYGSPCRGNDADLRRVMLMRKNDGKTTSYQVDNRKEVRTNDIRFDPILVEGDVIYVPECGPAADMRPKIIAS